MVEGTVRPTTRTTLRMVAERAGVSTATVSYVLSGRSGGRTGVSEATVKRVRAAAEELDYFPNQAARAIRTGRTNLVLLSLTMLADPWAQAISDTVSSTGAPAGLTTLILADGDWAGVLNRQSADAAFIDHVGSGDEVEALRRLARRGYRLVVFSEDLEPEGFDVIRSDAIPGCRLAMRHLLQDHERVGCLSLAPEISKSQRFQVYLDEMAAAGLKVRDDHVEFHERTAPSAFAAATRLLSRDDPPSAIYAISDFAAIAAIQAAARLRLRVPEDVAIIGVGNTIEGEQTAPTLSSVGPTDFFTRVAEIIRDRALGVAPEPSLHEFEWSLFARESTDLRRQRTAAGE